MTMKNPPHPGLSLRHDCIEPLDLTITSRYCPLEIEPRWLVNKRCGPQSTGATTC